LKYIAGVSGPLPFFRIALSVGLVCPFLANGEVREWKTKDGKHSVKAGFVSIQGEIVTLKNAVSGKKKEISVSILSDVDRKYLAGLRKEKPQSDGGVPDSKAANDRNGESSLLNPNYEDPWPTVSAVEGDVLIDLVEEDKERQRFVYHSAHYEFVCDVRLKKSLVGKFAKMFETTFQAMVDLPLNFEKARGFDSSKRLKIALFETEETYIMNGGQPGSAGMYRFNTATNEDLVMVPLSSLGVKSSGSSYRLDRKVSNRTLVHELAHQLTDRSLYVKGSRGWFTEGFAEYVCASKYSHATGRITFGNNVREITAYATDQDKSEDGRNLGEEILVGSLKDYMLQPYEDFTGDAVANKNYGVGLLITTWLIHMDDGGSRKNLTAFLKAGREGKEGEELLAVLRNGRTWEELEAEIAKDWKKKGRINIRFSK